MKRRVLYQTAVLLIVLCGLTEAATSKISFCDTKPICFPVIGTAKQPALAAEIQGGFYEKGTTDSEIRTKLQELSEKEKLAIPEYLILKELSITKNGTFDDFLGNYYGEDGKKYARGLVSDFAELQKYAKTITGISFQCKALYDDLVRIRYQRHYDDGSQMGWSSILKKIDERYYFVAPDNKNIFHDIAEEFWQLRDRDLCEKDSLASLQKVSFVAEDARYPLAVYIKPMSPKNDGQLITFLNKWIKACQKGTIEDIVAFYSDEAAEILRDELSSEPDVLKDFRGKFSDIEKIDISFMVSDKSTAAISITLTKNGNKVEERLVLITFADGKPRITFPDSSLAIAVLQHEKVKEQLEKPSVQ